MFIRSVLSHKPPAPSRIAAMPTPYGRFGVKVFNPPSPTSPSSTSTTPKLIGNPDNPVCAGLVIVPFMLDDSWHNLPLSSGLGLGLKYKSDEGTDSNDDNRCFSVFQTQFNSYQPQISSTFANLGQPKLTTKKEFTLARANDYYDLHPIHVEMMYLYLADILSPLLEHGRGNEAPSRDIREQTIRIMRDINPQSFKDWLLEREWEDEGDVVIAQNIHNMARFCHVCFGFFNTDGTPVKPCNWCSTPFYCDLCVQKEKEKFKYEHHALGCIAPGLQEAMQPQDSPQDSPQQGFK